MDLKPIGIWTFAFDRQPIEAVREAVAEIENLGYGAIWFGEAVGREAFTQAALLLAATERIVVANGIARIGARDARSMAAGHRTLTEAYPDRYLLGLGGSTQLGGNAGPVESMRSYLDGMDDAMYIAPPPPTPLERVLAALGPAMLRLAAGRTRGAHTYLVPPEHTAIARRTLGPGPLLAVEQAAVLDQDAAQAREIGRTHLEFYLRVPTYRNNFLRLGYEEDDFAGGGSDRLVDAIVAYGDLEDIVKRVRAHLEAGADHVCIQVLTFDPSIMPLSGWRELAPALSPLMAGR